MDEPTHVYLVVRGEIWEGYKVRSAHRSLAEAEKSKTKVMAEDGITDHDDVDYAHIIAVEVED